jgi:pilus assembly protein FimV
MYRKLASVILVASAINAKYAYALGLGEMTMFSSLNEPLNAEIQLTNLGDLDASQVIIKLPDDSQFNNAGIERTFFLSNLKFSVVVDAKGNGVVKLKSEKRLNEPFLDFLLEAKWPTGRVLRSYTALVDLPVYSEASVSTVNMSDEQSEKARSGQTITTRPDSSANINLAPAELPQSVSVASASDAEPKPVIKSPPAQTRVQSQPSNSERSYFKEPVKATEYGTKRGDTLWEIASSNRPATDVSVQQVMITIQRNNPEAFIGGNINRLKAGMVLELPSAEQVYEVTRSSAVTEVGRQNEDLSYAPQIDASPVEETPVVPSVTKDQGHLSLAASGDSAGNGDGDSSLTGNGNGNNDVLASENVSLNKQVDSLSTQVEQLERLLEIKEQQLAQFQNSLSQPQVDTINLETDLEQVDVTQGIVETSDTVEVSALGDEPVLDVENSNVDSVETSSSIENTVIEPAETTSELDSASEADISSSDVAPSNNAGSEQSSFLDTLLATPMYLGGIALLIMGLVAGLFIRKRNQAEQAAIDSLESFEFDQTQETDAEDTVADNIVDDAQDETQLVDAAEEELAEPDDSENVRVETGDAIGEAEIYIAYGRFDEASELLKSALVQSPNDIAVRSKLLEVYAQSGNQELFLTEFNVLKSQGESDAVNAAKELLSSVEGGSSWLDDQDNVDASSTLDDLDEIDLSLDDDNSELVYTDTSPESNVDQIVEQDLDLDLDLDAPSDIENSIADDNLDLDLNLNDLSDDSDTLNDSITELDLSDDLDLNSDLDLDLANEVDTSSPETAAVEEVLDTLDDAVDDLSLDLDALDDESSDNLMLDSELNEQTFDTDDLDLSNSLELDDGELDAGLSSESEDILDLGDVDLGLDASEAIDDVELDIDESLSLGDEIDLSGSSDAELDLVADTDSDLDAPLENHDTNASIESDQGSSVIEDDLSFITDEDEISTKLDLARAYVEMGDADGAKDILTEVIEEGSDAQVTEAKSMLDELA